MLGGDKWGGGGQMDEGIWMGMMGSLRWRDLVVNFEST